MKLKENLENKRIISIDAFRGITIFTMIFVNELAGMKAIPQWLGHMPANADGMTFVDVVFPAFLFIVGMSIPFSFNARLAKKQSSFTIWKHTLKRTLALIVMGVLMVNAEYGYDASKMIITPAFWGFLAYTVPIPIWNKYAKDISLTLKRSLQIGGVVIIVALYFLYVQDGGGVGMTKKWWGILGLIGWAYLISVLVYWFTNGKLLWMFVFLTICVTGNSMNLLDDHYLHSFSAFKFIAGHMTHATLVVSGIIISLLFFEFRNEKLKPLFILGTAVVMVLTGYLLRPYFGVSKIGGTPSWTLYCAAWCIVLFYGLFLLMERKKVTKWANFFMPAAKDPLLIYILPGILMYFNLAVGIKILPEYLTEGLPAVIWSLLFSVIMLYLVKVLNRFSIQLHL